MTAMLDAIEPRGGVVALGSLITIGALGNLSEQAVRSAVNRLAAEDWLTRTSLGRKSVYRLSDKGRQRALFPRKRIYYRQSSEWTGQWQLLIDKDWLHGNEAAVERSRDLSWNGFGRVSHNVFICPERKGDGLTHLGSVLPNDSVVSIVGRPDGEVGSGVTELIEHCWDIGVIQRRYEAFEACYTPLLELLKAGPGMRSRVAFAARMLMIHDFRRIRLADPQLPEQLLPYGWVGDRAWHLAKDIYQRLLDNSEHYITEFVDGADEFMPPADPALYSRFDGLAPR